MYIFLTIIAAIVVLFISVRISASMNTKKYKNLVEKDSKIDLNDFWKAPLGNSEEIRKVMRNGISKKLFYGKIKIPDKNISTIGSFSKPTNEDELIGEFKPSNNLLIYVEETLKFVDNLAKEKNIDKYGFVDLKTNVDSQNLEGTYLYKFTNEDNLLLLKAPFNFLFKYGNEYPYFNAELLNDVLVIPMEEIRYIHQSDSFEFSYSEKYLSLYYDELKNINETSLSMLNTKEELKDIELKLDDYYGNTLKFTGITFYAEYEKYLERKKSKEKIEKDNDIVVQRAFFKYVSSDKELSKKLNEFILTYVRKYDTEQISLEKYLKRIEQLVEYFMNKINIKLHNETDENFEKLKDTMSSNEINVTYTELEKFINDRKYELYSKEMKKEIKVNEYQNTEDLVNNYIKIYGKRSTNEVNIKTLSLLIDEDYPELKEKIESEYNRIQTTYKLNKLEEELFSGEEIKDISYVDSLSGFEFEDFLKELLQSYGYTAEDLPYSNDYGADLIISKGNKKTVIQAKNYNGSVGNKAVQEVVSAKVYYKCDIAMVITNSYFTQNALKTAKESDVVMIDRDKLDKILNEGKFYFDYILI